MKKVVPFLILMLVCLGSNAWAQSVANVDAVVTYTEPNKVIGGAALTQLQHTTIYFEVRDVGGVVLEQWTEEMTATAPTGGGDITYLLPPRVITPESNVFMVWASATNTIGESLKAGPFSTQIPKVDLVVPDGVLNLNITISIKVTTPVPQ